MDNDQVSIGIQSDDERSTPELREESDEGQLALDILETEDEIVIIAPVAGIDEKSIDIVITDDVLTIRGSRPRPSGLPQKAKYIIDECYWGAFSRNILLPSAINSAEISARLERDIVLITVPKARKVKIKKIPLSPKL
jgi:HSP20 family protein